MVNWRSSFRGGCLAALLIAGLPARAQNQEIDVIGTPNPGVQFASTQVVGNPSGLVYYYWVIANFPGGSSMPAAPVIVNNAPAALSGSNYVAVTWSTATGATSYDVLRTSTPNLPATSCTCAVATGLVTNTTNDTGAALGSYSLNVKPPVVGKIRLDNTGASPQWVFSPTVGVSGGITQLTGDVTAGPGSGSQPAALATTGVSPGSYTNANINVDAKGRILSASNGSVSGSSTNAISNTSTSVSMGPGNCQVIYGPATAFTVTSSNTLVSGTDSGNFYLGYLKNATSSCIRTLYYGSGITIGNWNTPNWGSVQSGTPPVDGTFCQVAVVTVSAGVMGTPQVTHAGDCTLGGPLAPGANLTQNGYNGFGLDSNSAFDLSSASNTKIIKAGTIAARPTAAAAGANAEYLETDGASTCDTSTGGGTTAVLVESNGTAWSAPNCGSGGSGNAGVIVWSTNYQTLNTGTSASWPGQAAGFSGNFGPIGVGCSAKNLTVYVPAAVNVGGNIVFTLFDLTTSTGTALTKTVAAGSAIGVYADNTDSVIVNPTHLYEIQIVNNSTASNAGDWAFSFQCN